MNPISKSIEAKIDDFLYSKDNNKGKKGKNYDSIHELISSHSISIKKRKKIRDLYLESYPKREFLTKDQIKLQLIHKIRFPEIWKSISSAHCLQKDRYVLRRFFQNTLQYARNKCTICNATTVTKQHIFFECKATNAAHQTIQILASKWSGKSPPWTLQGIIEILKAKPLYQAIYISIFGSIWRETNKCIFEKKEALSSFSLRCLLKDSISRIVRMHFSKFRYAMAKAKKEDQEKIKKKFINNWVDNNIVTLKSPISIKIKTT